MYGMAPNAMEVTCKNITLLERVIKTLISCKKHRGGHHFVVYGDELKAIVNPSGIECIKHLL